MIRLRDETVTQWKPSSDLVPVRIAGNVSTVPLVTSVLFDLKPSGHRPAVFVPILVGKGSWRGWESQKRADGVDDLSFPFLHPIEAADNLVRYANRL